MTLHAHKLSLAATITMSIVYAVCAVFSALWPAVALKFLGWMLHLVNVGKIADGTQVGLGTFMLGLLPIIFYSYITTYLFARL
ncbi:hypothetical protein HY573_02615 [Candidatus Parcubacteria bacterium]|nr:hypothetical protein [Candidatus Parcubacteria bacterium]